MNYEFSMSDETSKASATTSNPHDVLKFFSNEDLLSELKDRGFGGYITTELKIRDEKNEIEFD